MTTRVSEEVSRNLTLRRIYASDNYSFSVEKIWCLFQSILSTLFQNYSLGENTTQKLSGIMKNEQHTNERRRHKDSPFSIYNTKRSEGTMPLHTSTNFRVKRGRNDTPLPPYESQSQL